jgi:hypothetical protein
VTAAAAVLREPVRNQMSYEQRLAMMANTAFSDRDTSGRRAGMQSMDQLVVVPLLSAAAIKSLLLKHWIPYCLWCCGL